MRDCGGDRDEVTELLIILRLIWDYLTLRGLDFIRFSTITTCPRCTRSSWIDGLAADSSFNRSLGPQNAWGEGLHCLVSLASFPECTSAKCTVIDCVGKTVARTAQFRLDCLLARRWPTLCRDKLLREQHHEHRSQHHGQLELLHHCDRVVLRAWCFDLS